CAPEPEIVPLAEERSCCVASVAAWTTGAVTRCAASLTGAMGDATPSMRGAARRFARGRAAASLEVSLRTALPATPAGAGNPRTGAARPGRAPFSARGCAPARAPERCAAGPRDDRLTEPAPELALAVPVTSAD